jgi:hypothetical protein
MRRERLPGLHHFLRVGPGPLEGIGRYLPDRVRAEEEAGDDAEVPSASTAQRPVKIGVLLRARDHRLAVGEDDGRPEQVVARQAELARREADTAAEREARDPDGGTRTARNRPPMACKPVVDVDQPSARTDNGALLRVERHAVQP